MAFSDFLNEMLIKQYGSKITQNIINGYFVKRPVTLRVNTLKTNVESIKKIL